MVARLCRFKSCYPHHIRTRALIQSTGSCFAHTSRQKVLKYRLFDGFFVFCRLSSADENTRLMGVTADFVLHLTNGYLECVHPTNGNKVDLNTVFTRQTGRLGLIKIITATITYIIRHLDSRESSFAFDSIQSFVAFDLVSLIPPPHSSLLCGTIEDHS